MSRHLKRKRKFHSSICSRCLKKLTERKPFPIWLLPVGERARHLFGKDEGNVTAPKKKKKIPQLDLFKVLEEVDGEETISDLAAASRGTRPPPVWQGRGQCHGT